MCGADVDLILGAGSVAAPPWLNARIAESVEHYRQLVLDTLQATPHQGAVLSAAVSDFEPTEIRQGKVKTADGDWKLHLRPTAKVIDAVHKKFPALHMVGFKYEETSSHEALMETARSRAAARCMRCESRRRKSKRDCTSCLAGSSWPRACANGRKASDCGCDSHASGTSCGTSSHGAQLDFVCIGCSELMWIQLRCIRRCS